MRHAKSTNLPQYSYTGRLAYLRAFAEVRTPSPLQSLSIAIAKMEFLLEMPRRINPEDGLPGRYAAKFFWRRFCAEKTKEAMAVRKALKKWRSDFQIQDDWIMDAALQTVVFTAAWDHVESVSWIYSPSEDQQPMFAPVFKSPQWLPGREEWPAFRKRMADQFTKQLRQYRNDVDFTSPTAETAHLEEVKHAYWLAKYVAGKDWPEIAQDEVKAASPQNIVGKIDVAYIDVINKIRNGSVRLAKRIRLTWPPKRPDHVSKKTGLTPAEDSPPEHKKSAEAAGVRRRALPLTPERIELKRRIADYFARQGEHERLLQADEWEIGPKMLSVAEQRRAVMKRITDENGIISERRMEKLLKNRGFRVSKAVVAKDYRVLGFNR